MPSSRSKLRALVAAEVNRPARPSSRSPHASANELATNLALAPDLFHVIFSLRGERFSVTVPARNRDDAKRLAWVEARDILDTPDYAALVLCQCSRTPPTP